MDTAPPRCGVSVAPRTRLAGGRPNASDATPPLIRNASEILCPAAPTTVNQMHEGKPDQQHAPSSSASRRYGRNLIGSRADVEDSVVDEVHLLHRESEKISRSLNMAVMSPDALR